MAFPPEAARVDDFATFDHTGAEAVTPAAVGPAKAATARRCYGLLRCCCTGRGGGAVGAANALHASQWLGHPAWSKCALGEAMAVHQRLL